MRLEFNTKKLKAQNVNECSTSKVSKSSPSIYSKLITKNGSY